MPVPLNVLAEIFAVLEILLLLVIVFSISKPFVSIYALISSKVALSIVPDSVITVA